jgi:uncharacterized membrane protein YtjA (UPF0391 family)
MVYFAFLFLVVGLLAGALHFAGVSVVAVQISWALYLVGMVFAAIHLATRRTVQAT